ncbi:MAG: hypothetical protein EOP04_09475, partial [Proteobacteria bacterium]
MDFASLFTNGLRLIYANEQQPRLSKTIDVLGKVNHVRYQAASNPEVYSQKLLPTYPLRAYLGTSLLVRELSEEYLDKRQKVLQYHYRDGLIHQAGLGFLGFGEWDVVDLSVRTLTRKYLSQDFENLKNGLVTRQDIIKISNGSEVLLSAVSTQYLSKMMDRTRSTYRLILEDSSLAKMYSESGDLIATTRTKSSYDDYANLVTQDSFTEEPNGKIFSAHTLNKYEKDNPSEWIFGRITESKVTKKKLGLSDIVKTSKFDYDANGLLREEIIEPGTEYESRKIYGRTNNKFGHVDSVTTSWAARDESLSVNSYTNTSQFDQDGFLVQETNALGHSKTLIRDENTGWVKKSIDINGLETDLSFREDGSVGETLGPDGTRARSDSYWCDDTCPASAVFYTRSRATGAAEVKAYFNDQGLEVQKESRDYQNRLILTRNEYTLTGKLKRSSLPYFDGQSVIWNEISYDSLDRAERMTGADGAELVTKRDGLEITTYDPLGHKTIKYANASGNVEKIVNEKGEPLLFTYDALGRLVEVKDPKENVTRQEYDILDRKTLSEDPNTGTTRTYYNGLNLPYKTIDDLGTVSLIFYDILGRKIRQEITTKTEQTIDKWYYDRDKKTLGLLYALEGSGYREDYFFDDKNRPERTATTIDGRSFIQSQSYDNKGRLKRALHASGLSIIHNYDERTGTLLGVKREGKDKSYWTLLDSYADGVIKETLLSNGVKTQTEQNLLNGSIQSFVVKNVRGEIVESRGYGYDIKGNVTFREDRLHGKSETVTYDALDRMETVTDHLGKTVSLAYDELGNIRSRSDRGSYFYNEACAGGKASPQALSRVGENRFCYNALGQLTEGAGKKVLWGAYGVPIEIQKGENFVKLRYNPMGQRIETLSRQSTGLRKTMSIGVFDEISDQDGVEQRHNLPGGLVVTSRGGKETEEYLHKDLLGSIVSITGPQGEVLERLDFDPWGLRRDVKSNKSISDYQTVTKNRFGFTGHEELDAVDLIHMNGRIYDPSFGRFLSPDPFVQSPDNLQSMNRYSYVWNNPLTNTDPSGYF